MLLISPNDYMTDRQRKIQKEIVETELALQVQRATDLFAAGLHNGTIALDAYCKKMLYTPYETKLLQMYNVAAYCLGIFDKEFMSSHKLFVYKINHKNNCIAAMPVDKDFVYNYYSYTKPTSANKLYYISRGVTPEETHVSKRDDYVRVKGWCKTKQTIIFGNPVREYENYPNGRADAKLTRQAMKRFQADYEEWLREEYRGHE